LGEARIQIDICSLDSELPTLRHRIARIDDQIQDDLLDLNGVCLDTAQVGYEGRDEIDVFAGRAREHPLKVGHDGVSGTGFGVRASAGV